MKKGELLEKVVAHFCSDIEGAKVTHNAKIFGRNSKTERQADVLIEGKYGFFEIKIQIEAKDYKRPVTVERVEAFSTMIKDTGVDLGVMVCTSGFSSTAKSIADANNIQLFQMVSDILGNSDLFIPVRMIFPEISSFAVHIEESSCGPFSLPFDLSKIRIEKQGRFYNLKQMLLLAWNDKKVPVFSGKHTVNLDAVKIINIDEPKKTQYCELAFSVSVRERYYLKLYPANFLKRVKDGKTDYSLTLDLYTNYEDMKKHWKEYSNLEDLDKAADIENQPVDVKKLLIRPFYSINVDSANFDEGRV